jgi:hypothetical protein
MSHGLRTALPKTARQWMQIHPNLRISYGEIEKPRILKEQLLKFEKSTYSGGWVVEVEVREMCS